MNLAGAAELLALRPIREVEVQVELRAFLDSSIWIQLEKELTHAVTERTANAGLQNYRIPEGIAAAQRFQDEARGISLAIEIIKSLCAQEGEDDVDE